MKTPLALALAAAMAGGLSACATTGGMDNPAPPVAGGPDAGTYAGPFARTSARCWRIASSKAGT